MTLLPDDTRLVIPRLDLEPYELPGVCQFPDCDETHGLEDHHLWRRSFGKDFREAWWVELTFGERTVVMPNRIHLCPAHHLPVTDNEVRIRFIVGGTDGSGPLFSVFTWENKTEGVYLGDLLPPAGPQGGASGRTPGGTDAEGRSAMQLTVTGEEVPHDEVCDEQHGTEETCPKCKGAGKVQKRAKRKASSGTGKTQVIAIRIPASEEGGFERLSSLHDAAEEILVQQGLLRERANGAAFYRDSAIYGAFVTEHRELLPEDWKKGEFDTDEREDA